MFTSTCMHLTAGDVIFVKALEYIYVSPQSHVLRNIYSIRIVLSIYGFGQLKTRLLALFRAMEFSIKLHTIKSGWSIVYIEGSQVIISKNIIFLSLKINFVLANSADPWIYSIYLGMCCFNSL